MIGNRRLGIGSAGAEASSFSLTFPASTTQIYTFRIATSTGFFIMVDNANRRIPTTGAYTSAITTLPMPPASVAYTAYDCIGNGATSCTVFSTNSAGQKSGIITQLDIKDIGVQLLPAGALDVRKCAKSLTYINIGGQTNISSVTGLSSCIALTELQANSCGFQSLDCSSLTELLTVVASNNQALTAFTANAKLKSLTIFNCPNLPTAAFALEPANATLEFLDCSRCSSLSDLQFGSPALYNGRNIKLAALKVLDVSNTGQQSASGGFWPSYSNTTVVSITAQNLPYIPSLSLVDGSNTGAWPALTTLNLSGSTLRNDPWRIPVTVSALNLTNIAFGEVAGAEIGINLTGCTSLRGKLEDVLSIVGATVPTTNTTTTVRQLILDGSGFDSINIAGDPVLLTLSAQGMPNLTSFTLLNTAWLKTIQITNNSRLASVNITGATNRTLVDITVTISGNTFLTTKNLLGAWTQKQILPTVTSVTPNIGKLAAGTAITITGTNLTGATSVTVGGVAAFFTVVSATQITAVTPTGTVGTKIIDVSSPIGTSVSTIGFQYVATPTVTSRTPSSGSRNGGTVVTFTGTNFTGVHTVKMYNGANIMPVFTNIVITSDTSMKATTPAIASSQSVLVNYSIHITNLNGSMSTSASQEFMYT